MQREADTPTDCKRVEMRAHCEIDDKGVEVGEKREVGGGEPRGLMRGGRGKQHCARVRATHANRTSSLAERGGTKALLVSKDGVCDVRGLDGHAALVRSHLLRGLNGLVHGVGCFNVHVGWCAVVGVAVVV
jgi:hypothetical protein